MGGKMNELPCIDSGCDDTARWFVWFAGWPIYGAVCDKHAAQYLEHGKGGWPVTCLRIMPPSFLRYDDRVLVKEAEELKKCQRFHDEPGGMK
jgi:hypothetical protein